MSAEAVKRIENLPLYEATSSDGSSRERCSAEDVAFAEDPVNYHLRANRKFGPIYRVRFRNDIWVAIGGLEANDFAWRNPKLWSYREAMAGFGEELGFEHVTTMDRAPHLEKRLNLKAGFGFNPVMRHLPAVSRVVSDSLSNNANHEVDLYDFCTQTIVRASGRTMVEADLSEEMICRMANFEERFMYGLNLGEDRKRFFSHPDYLEVKGLVFEFLRQLVREREQDDTADDNLAAVIRKRSEENREYRVEEKTYDAYLLLIAGAENSTKLINWILQYLAQNPDWTQELREELSEWNEDSFRNGMTSFPKLKATIMEGERLQPGALFLNRVAATNFELFGYRVPSGTLVFHNQTLCHFLEEIYEDPFQFKPRRWIESSYPKKAHGTFGGGSHVCLGMNVTRLHAPVFVANIVRNFDLKLNFKPDFRHVVDLGGAFHRVPLPAVFVSRK